MSKFKSIFFLFLVFLFINLLTSFFAKKYVPYLGFFPYVDVIKQYGLPPLITSFANFDGAHYLSIAKHSYAQYEQAYFPLYPLLINFFSPLFKKNLLTTGLVISNLSFFLGLVFCYKFLKKILKGNEIGWFFIFLLLFPTSFFFSAVYTEGLFFLLITASFYFLQKKNYLFVSFFTFLASTTRVIGIFLIIPVFFHLYANRVRFRLKHLAVLLSPVAGFAAYAIYLLKTTGDPLFFFHSQPLFGAQRSASIIFLPQVYFRYLKIFITARWNFQYFVSLIEFFIFNLVFLVIAIDLLSSVKNRWLVRKGSRQRASNEHWREKNLWQAPPESIGLSLFSLANLILPTLTGTFSSIPRYALFSFSFFLSLSQIKNNLIKIIICVVFFLLHTTLLALFIQGYFIS